MYGIVVMKIKICVLRLHFEVKYVHIGASSRTCIYFISNIWQDNKYKLLIYSYNLMARALED